MDMFEIRAEKLEKIKQPIDMKHLRRSLIYLLLLVLNPSCIGQSNIMDTKVSIHETLPEINDEERIELARKELPKDHSVYFDLDKEYYFDDSNRMPFQKYLIDSLGEFTIYYYSKSRELKDYYHNFEDENNIKGIYSEIDDVFFYSDSDRLKIDKILRYKIDDNLADYNIIGTYIAKQYITIDHDDLYDEYSISFPWTRLIYNLNDKGEWIFIKEEIISDYTEDILPNTL